MSRKQKPWIVYRVNMATGDKFVHSRHISEKTADAERRKLTRLATHAATQAHMPYRFTVIGPVECLHEDATTAQVKP